MPQTTQRLKIPYPLSTDKVADYPQTGKQLAEKIEAVIESLSAIPNLNFATDPGFTTTIKSVHAMGPLRIATLTIARKSAGGYQSGYHWKIGTVGTTTERPKIRHFGTIMGKADPYLYIDPNGEIHMQFWSAGTWPNSTWDAQIVWAVN